ncbi:SMC-Scp complex subunit ScpB [Candidatus Woesearchaeota archaeon]|nr:SMC-Scp complex subunit ScpB [Candidatus Woesearchaeota archaeon]
MADAVDNGHDLKRQLEAALFASGRKMAAEELARLCRSTPAVVRQQLQELKAEYENKDSSLLLMEEADGWKLTVREQFSPVVQKVVPETELTKTVIETLAVIAWKAPVLQSNVIKFRTNKAYDHIAALEKSGFITREKRGRSQMIKLTERFFKYFDVKTPDEVKEKFKGLSEAAMQTTQPQPQQQVQQPGVGSDSENSSESSSKSGENASS